MTDFELNKKLKDLAGEERRLTRMVLEHIAEVDRRKLFLRMAYGSLFDYLVKEIGYSAGAAQRRMDGARMLANVPELAAKVENGVLNLGQVTKVRKACREMYKRGERVSVERQRHMLQKMEGLGARETDLLIAKEFGCEVIVETKEKIQQDESVRVELTFTKKEMELLRDAQAMLSNQTGGGLKETLIALARKAMTKSALKSTATVAVKSVTPKLRRTILDRDQYRCQFVDHTTGKVCGEMKFLEIDHIRPRFAGGDNTAENLRALCRNHNQFRYKAAL